jgi:glycosyltransferase involved in cell wall biosynthesis
MRILFDIQACQTRNGRNRGIGNYSMAMAKTYASEFPEDHTYFLSNLHDPESAREVRTRIGSAIPPHRLKFVRLPKIDAFSSDATSFQNRMQSASLDLSYGRFNPDVLHVSSLFEPELCYPPSLGGAGKLRSVTIYDLIPLIFEREYLNDEKRRLWYHSRLQALKQYDVFLTISDNTRRDLIHRLGVEPDRVFNISAACDGRYSIGNETSEKREAFCKRYGIDRPFLLYTGGADWRKNMSLPIRAYAAIEPEIRKNFCLVIVCALPDQLRAELASEITRLGLSCEDVILSGYVSNDDMVLFYRLCHAFIFPSLYEGFGLPVLEAISCGAPAVVARNSSLVEIIERRDAHFFPESLESTAAVMHNLMINSAYRDSLIEYGCKRAKLFSWEKTARKVHEAWSEMLKHNATQNQTVLSHISGKRKLALASPIPPQSTGIADYTAELLKALSKYYYIDIYTQNPEFTDKEIASYYTIRSISSLAANYSKYDRVLYQMGNSIFHSEMTDLIPLYPGVVVLHDFFLSGLANHLEYYGERPGFFTKELLLCGGLQAAEMYKNPHTARRAIDDYPANSFVFNNSLGVIVHSHFSQSLIEKFYPEGVSTPVLKVPFIKQCKYRNDFSYSGNKIRKSFGIDINAIIICSFGHITSTKSPTLVVEAYERLVTKFRDKNILLRFIGALTDDHHGETFLKRVSASPVKNRIKITGYTTKESYENWLIIADISVQLRTTSRGETSAAILDCLAAGVPVIANAYASSTDYPDDAISFVSRLPDSEELCDAMIRLLNDKKYSKNLTESGLRLIDSEHSPDKVAASYNNVIESFYAQQRARSHWTALDFCLLEPRDTEVTNWVTGLSCTLPVLRKPRLYYDISLFANQWNSGYFTGIQRVVHKILLQFERDGENLWPVVLNDVCTNYYVIYRDINGKWEKSNVIVNFQHGDLLFIPELRHSLSSKFPVWKKLADALIEINLILFDLLPVLHPECYPPEARTLHIQYLEFITEKVDVLHAISHTVVSDFLSWRSSNLPGCRLPKRIDVIPLGPLSDLSSQGASSVPPWNVGDPVFLMVGTLEPRKRHNFVLDVFDNLWIQGYQVRLCILGKQGWMAEQLIERIKNHKELNNRLIYLDKCDDDTLINCYKSAACLLAASINEGFGLPLLEAASYGLPIIASDIPVFREIFKDHISYFSAYRPESLANEISNFLEKGIQSKSQNCIPVPTWSDTISVLMKTSECNRCQENSNPVEIH